MINGKKIVAMIPARLGSQRIPKKNLRLLGNKVLTQWVGESCKKTNIFDEIYINSESEIFERIATDIGIKFYKRPNELASNSATNDDFSLDFINNVECDILVQVNPTSPFTTPEDIEGVVKMFINGDYKTVHTVKDEQIEGLFNDIPLNFDPLKQMPPSQELTPVKIFTSSIMAWDTQKFKENMKKNGCAVYGGNGKIGYYTIKGAGMIDIDNEKDFYLAEAVIKMNEEKQNKKYYDLSNQLTADANVPKILKQDGVEKSIFDMANQGITHVPNLIQKYGKNSSWSHTLVDTESNSATLICQLPGEGNRRHYHPDWNEWWFIIDGTWQWDIDNEVKTIQKGDLVFIQKGIKHKITAIGNEAAIRIAVSRYDVDHVYDNEDY
ncbi:cytidylyltransferase domain-containing protein [Halarcobacter sp.]|uniref:cytidylyltransferase domain-containing protein n=1 Tax=Halarcobacter sp. TaxID=2321133 RepID=UPI002AA737AF|nr:cupin domain-containing protein [Halarcobacter sp.]